MQILRKIIPITIALLLMLSCSPQQSEEASEVSDNSVQLSWLTNLEAAMEIARQDDKTIFVNFTGSDWCGWCFKLDDEVFSQSQFIQFSQDNLVMLEIDFPRDIPQSDEVKIYNRKLLESFNIPGFPTILLLNEDGIEINRTGYQPGGADKYIAHISGLIGKIS